MTLALQYVNASGASIGGQSSGYMASPGTLGIASPTRNNFASPRTLSVPISPGPIPANQIQAAAPEIDKGKDNKEILGPQLEFPVAAAAALFATSIVLLYFCIDASVNSISALTEPTSLTDTFVGLILLPIHNCDFAPISVAIDEQLEQTMTYKVSRSIQTALLVEPAIVLLAWILSIPDGYARI